MEKFDARDPKALELALHDLFPEDWLREKARELGVVERHRKIDPVVLFWTLALGFGIGTQRSLASLRRAYETNTGRTMAPSSFYDRFTPELVAFAKACVMHGLAQTSEPGRALSERLSGFDDVFVADGTLLRLNEELSGTWAGVRTNHSPASIKLSVVISLVGEGPRSVGLHAGRKADVDTLSVGPWVKGKLLLFDLGYYKFQKFDAIKRNKGFFISRVKDNANPEIVGVNRLWRGRSVTIEGKKLKEVLASLKRDVIDCEVEVSFQRRVYNGTRSGATMTLRLVGVKNKETGKYHLYFTNVPPERLSAEEVASMYGARWEVELLFLEMKKAYALDVLPSTKPEVVEALVYVGILTLIVSRRILATIRRRHPDKAHRMTNLRWAEVHAATAHKTLEKVLAHVGLHIDDFDYIDLLSGEAFDPNDDRERLSDRWLA
jgi:putative transposase